MNNYNKKADGNDKCHHCGRYLEWSRDLDENFEQIPYVCECEYLPTPLCRPQFNFSDMIIIKNALQVARDSFLPELQGRVDLIIAELLRAEMEVKNGNLLRANMESRKS